jgi:hypothetical protein
MYTSSPFYRSEAHKLLDLAGETRQKVLEVNGSLPAAHLSPKHNTESLFQDDALSTILGFLHQKMLEKPQQRQWP